MFKKIVCLLMVFVLTFGMSTAVFAKSATSMYSVTPLNVSLVSCFHCRGGAEQISAPRYVSWFTGRVNANSQQELVRERTVTFRGSCGTPFTSVTRQILWV